MHPLIPTKKKQPKAPQQIISSDRMKKSVFVLGDDYVKGFARVVETFINN